MNRVLRYTQSSKVYRMHRVLGAEVYTQSAEVGRMHRVLGAEADSVC